ncbi:EXS, C-terminal [Cynara cardunculus var. scolymus]|uniref:EXS, C-terminal n=1 Tax=Cynara cardunculus var. scolymus TaxID=59895 RepID=A0A118JV95_CYNCS|nr:EXS, C-terminal [Cynara cardunculus var. scolymus]
MKFGKEFASQMVPEWQEAYMNYNYLKTLLKEILIFRQRQTRSSLPAYPLRPPPAKATSLKRRASLFRAFSGLTGRYGNTSPKEDNEDEVILVNAMQKSDEEQGEDCRSYQTIFLRSAEEGGEFELVFFKRLDFEFNKVIQFYRGKVEEVVQQAEELNIQMDALIALRIKVNDPAAAAVVSPMTNNDPASVSPFINQRNTGSSPLEAIHEVEMSNHGNEKEPEKKRLNGGKDYKLASLEVLNHIKINATPETPRSTMRSVFNSTRSDLHFNKKELRDAQEKLKKAFIEFHQKLRLLILLKSEGRDAYMNTIFPLYSLFGFIVLHILMYAGNLYYWTRYRVNYSFIFGFKAGTELGFREVLLLGSGLLVLTLAAILSNLEMDIDPKTKGYKAITELLPLGLLIVVVLITLCPFNIFYRSNRYFLLVCLWHCICAPLYIVTLPDFFLGDQLTSQVQLLRNLEFYVCYYGWGDFKNRDAGTCEDGRSTIYRNISIVIAVVPYWIRLLQCLRRLFEGQDSTQALNGLKYFSTIVAVVARTLDPLDAGVTIKIISATSSVIATIFSTYWDLVKDWGLLCRNSENPWLRDKLILPNRSIYFVAMILNVILRLAWMQSVLDVYDTPFLHRKAVVTIVACLEIIRRGIWNFFRLENEHLNNVGKFRAVKSVPLPFSHEDGDKNL